MKVFFLFAVFLMILRLIIKMPPLFEAAKRENLMKIYYTQWPPPLTRSFTRAATCRFVIFINLMLVGEFYAVKFFGIIVL